ncbi:Dimethylallyltransferase [Borrelia nietonii YOR]|uniref:Dimethylallyltransferase n=1 Tax=Borrelia nietonii YOR TaxID=1293576 RepID=A0ABN4C7A7_9SPIR|nr:MULTISPECIES: polyprenyl synthetase family protein [Borrelia]AHH03291.1 Dimethylallyltransferase [Borrelia nietonii YOR]AHH13817.1 Dimethylallyltransferase [Borrelia hermsii MTW]UPA09033.1 polyprenyl synthetase family protein [Borrelia nietonii YOR]
MQNKSFLDKIEKNINYIFSKDHFLNLFKDKDLNLKLNTQESTIKTIKAPAIEIINRGGKRIRPMLMILLAHALGYNNSNTKNLYKLSMLLELPHSGSLIIDDIEDGAIKRRGKPAIHLIYGLDNSINTANLIYFLPAKLIQTANLKTSQQLLIYENFFTTLSNLHLGQGIDIAFHNGTYIPNVEEYISLVELKTSSLFGMAGFLAGILTNNENKAKNLYNTFMKLGTCFQIIDDIKNIKDGINGKEFGDDLIEGKKSLPIIYFLKEKQFDEQIIQDLSKIKNKPIDESREEILKFSNMINSSSAIKASSTLAISYLNKFIEELNSYTLINKYKDMIMDIVKKIKKDNL